MSAALEGVRVLDFGQYVAGPLASMLLADQGADVIRIDPPGGPRWTTPANATWNRAKRSIVLDLHAVEDLETARALIARADVLVENFRPGVMERLGLGHSAASDINPQLVYCSLPGFSEEDPRAATPAWEGVLGAASGTYTNRLARPPRERPAVTALPLSSSYGAFLGVASIAAALIARDRDGVGQRIEVPLFDATFTAVGGQGMKQLDQPPPPGRSAMTTPWVNQYECADGRWVQFLANPTRHRTAFVEAAGVAHWAADGLLDHAALPHDEVQLAELDRRMVALFKTRPAAEWEQLVNDVGTPLAICRESSEWLENDHALTSKAIIELDDPDLGPMRQPGVHPRLDRTPGAVRGPAPRLNADREAILAEAAADHLTRQRPTDPPPSPLAALDGVRVLDLCIILAGPTCGRTLAEFGADVVKIDNPNREGGIASHLDINRGKRSVLLDLATDAGKDVFWRLLDDADVVLQNYRAGAVERLGVGYEELRARKPDIVYASLNAYGHGGPWEHRRGWEHLAQAATGMQMRFGDTRPELQPFPVNDYATGVLGAYAVALALRHRNLTGEGQQVRSALAYTGTLLQSPYMQAFEGKRWDEPRGTDNLGFGPLQRLYQASDGWLFLGAHEHQRETVLASLDIPIDDGGIESVLESAIASTTVERAVARLLQAGVGAHAVRDVQSNMEGDWLISRGISLTREHQGPGRVRTTGPSPRLSRTPVHPGAPASAPGADGNAVLREYGLADDLPDLIASGVLVESL
ncbi:MAG: CoA transferase [Chloroflexi bacterium]|nr:CoA transferase [Chloroflexota bacterium]MDA1148334.1 CoA transferase [Chloroflexota bacterium]